MGPDGKWDDGDAQDPAHIYFDDDIIDEDPFPVGARVFHEEYGDGEVLRVSGFGRRRTITVTFQPQQADEVPNQAFQLPFPWLRELGLGRLMNLR